MARARQTRCLSNLGQLGQGLQQYVEDNQTYPLLVEPISEKKFNTWESQLNKQLGSSSAVDLRKGIWRCPSVRSEGILGSSFASYGYNAFGVGRTNSLGLGGSLGFAHPSYPDIKPAVAASDVVRPSEMMAIGDGFHGNGKELYPGQSLLWRHEGYQGFRDIEEPEKRHASQANVVFCDGHVEAPKLNFLFEDTSDAALVRWNRDHRPHKP